MYFHRTAPGGCCDCGDEEAWAEEGCCDRHRAPTGNQGIADPLASLPPGFQVKQSSEESTCVENNRLRMWIAADIPHGVNSRSAVRSWNEDSGRSSACTCLDAWVFPLLSWSCRLYPLPAIREMFVCWCAEFFPRIHQGYPPPNPNPLRYTFISRGSRCPR